MRATQRRTAPVKLVVMIPALNEEATLGRAVREVPRRFDGVDEVEVLVVDDGSTDGTVDVAWAAGADHVVSLKRNFGLTVAFRTGLQEALGRGADVIVNTDADCQYVGPEIARLIEPILSGRADLVSGDRQIHTLAHMPPAKKYGNEAGSWLLRTVAGSPVRDASSGFRAFSRECALRLNPTIGHTYTHQTIIQAVHSGMVIEEAPITFRMSAREGGKSRLISGVGSHIAKSLLTIARTMTAYKPLSVLGGIGLLVLLLGALVGLIPLAGYISQGNTEGHLQSLIVSTVLILMGLQLLVFGLLADTVSSNRRLTEETLYRLKLETLRPDSPAAQADRSAPAFDGALQD